MLRISSVRFTRTLFSVVGLCLAVMSHAAVQEDTIAKIRALRKLERQKSSPEILMRLALLYSEVRQYKLFELTMKEAMAADPRSHLPHYYLGRYFSSVVDDLPAAVVYFRQALQHKPDDYRSMYYLGFCDEQERRFDAAERRYQEAAKLAEVSKATFALPYEGLARLRLNALQAEAALPFARLAVKTGPAEASAHRTLAKCLDQLNQPRAAVDAWTAAVLLDPYHAPALYGLYRAQRSADDTAQAEQTLRQFRRISASYTPD